MQRSFGWGLVVLLMVGCESPAPPAAVPYEPIVDVRETMDWILLPAAEVIWDSAGTVITAEGHRELAPTTEAGWEEVRRNAAIVAETGNLLMVPGRTQGPEWIAYSRGLHVTGRLAMAAAEARDPDALFDAGGAVYQACVGCHTRYWITAGESEPAD
jgi:hypothetical protein